MIILNYSSWLTSSIADVWYPEWRMSSQSVVSTSSFSPKGHKRIRTDSEKRKDANKKGETSIPMFSPETKSCHTNFHPHQIIVYVHLIFLTSKLWYTLHLTCFCYVWHLWYITLSIYHIRQFTDLKLHMIASSSFSVSTLVDQSSLFVSMSLLCKGLVWSVSYMLSHLRFP